MDDDGNVLLPDGPGLGYELNWDYINEHRVAGCGVSSTSHGPQSEVEDTP